MPRLRKIKQIGSRGVLTNSLKFKNGIRVLLLCTIISRANFFNKIQEFFFSIFCNIFHRHLFPLMDLNMTLGCYCI